MDRPEPANPIEPDEQTRSFYVHALRTLDEKKVPYVVGGGYAMAYYTGIRRNTKDLDIFLKPEDHKRALDVLGAAGYRTEFFYPFWIAKALSGESFMDILYSSANGICRVDDEWICNGKDVEVLGYPTRLVPAEEQLWSKAFVQDRNRYDGADVAHLIMARGDQFDWERLLRRFKEHERVLLAHLVLYGYVYPTEGHRVPEWVIERLVKLTGEEKAPRERLCRGTNVAQKEYLPAVRQLGFVDARLKPRGPLTREELSQLPES